MKKTDLYLKPGTYIKSNAAIGDIQGISLENFVVSVLNNPTCCAKPVFIKDGLLMTDTSLSTSLQTVKDQVTNSSPLKLSTTLVRVESNLEIAERLKIESDSTVTTQTSAVIEATTTNSSIVLKPNGTGAIIASVPDGTATGGNPRGSNSVDLQQNRTINTKVASGLRNSILSGIDNLNSGNESVIGGGSSNTITQERSFIGSGFNNNISGGQSVISGGVNNNVSGLYSIIAGGASSANSSNYSTISGGQSNTASTNTHATVVGGQSNTASGQYSVAGGRTCVASGNRSVAFNDGSQSTGLGSAAFNSSISSGSYSTSFGANGNSTAQYSLVIGIYANGYFYNGFSHGSSDNTTGNKQYSNVISYRDIALTTSATTVLSLDGTGTTNLIIPNGNNRAWNVSVDWVAVVTTITGTATGITVGDIVTGESVFGFKRIGGTSSLRNFIRDSQAGDTTIMDTCSMVYTAGTSQELGITFTGPTFSGGGSVTMRIVAKVSLVEVAY